MTDRQKTLEWLKTLKIKMYATNFHVYGEYLDLAISALEKQEQSCDTCKHGRFGDEACINCYVGFPNHYEAEEEE